MKRAFKGMLGGFIGAIIGTAANVALTGLAMLAYPDDPSASSIGGVLIIFLLPTGIIIGIKRGLKKVDEEA